MFDIISSASEHCRYLLEDYNCDVSDENSLIDSIFPRLVRISDLSVEIEEMVDEINNVK